MLVETRFDTIIIGGGAIGTCLARDLSLRGLSVLLLEQGDLAEAYTGIGREILLGGATVGLRNAKLGEICARERDIIYNIAPSLIDSCKSYAVAVTEEEIKTIERIHEFCATANIPFEQVEVSDFLNQEPNCNPAIQQIFQTHDALINPALWIIHNAQDAQSHGAKILTYCEVSHLLIEDKTVIGVQYLNNITNQKVNAYGKFVINATGPWVSSLEKDLELPSIDLQSPNIDVTTLLVLQGQPSSNLIWSPGETRIGSLLIPSLNSVILGETVNPIAIDVIGDFKPDYDTLEALYMQGEKIVPALRNYRTYRYFSIFQARSSSLHQEPIPNTLFTLLNYHQYGISGFLSIFGGNLTISRYIAEKVADEIAQEMHLISTCQTALTKLWTPDFDPLLVQSTNQIHSVIPSNVALNSQVHACSPDKIHTVCPCYAIEKSQLESVRSSLDIQKLEDYSRRTGLGWGFCLGQTCLIRLCNLESQWSDKSHSRLLSELSSTLENRWKSVLVRDPQLIRQMKLMKYMFRMGGALQ